jgi:hypothetical protein
VKYFRPNVFGFVLLDKVHQARFSKHIRPDVFGEVINCAVILVNMENQVKLTIGIRPDVYSIIVSYRVWDFRLQGFRVSYTVFLTIYMNIYAYILRKFYAGYGT